MLWRMKIYGKAIVHGAATGEILYSKVPLSFWGGVEQTTGDIIDHHHPLFGENIKDLLPLHTQIRRATESCP